MLAPTRVIMPKKEDRQGKNKPKETGCCCAGSPPTDVDCRGCVDAAGLTTVALAADTLAAGVW